jgi:hypothetical protein
MSDDVLQIVGPVQPGQGQEEMGIGYDQVHIDMAMAVQLRSAAKRLILEGMVPPSQLLHDPASLNPANLIYS